MGGRRSGSWERVEAARRQARLALGKDADAPDDYGGRPKPSSPWPAAPGPTVTAHGPGVPVLMVGEAAARLNVSRAELEAMIAAGKVEGLLAGWTWMIPTREVERLQRS